MGVNMGSWLQGDGEQVLNFGGMRGLEWFIGGPIK
jgi:hypothetical protein